MAIAPRPQMLLVTPPITNCVLQAANDEAYLSSVLARGSLWVPANAEPSYGLRPKRRKSQGMTQVSVGAEGQSGVSLSFSPHPGLLVRPPNLAVCPCGRLLVPRRRGCVRKKNQLCPFLELSSSLLACTFIYFPAVREGAGLKLHNAGEAGVSQGKNGRG